MVVLHVRSVASVFGYEELVCVLGSLGLGCELVRNSIGFLLLWARVDLVEGCGVAFIVQVFWL